MNTPNFLKTTKSETTPDMITPVILRASEDWRNFTQTSQCAHPRRNVGAELLAREAWAAIAEALGLSGREVQISRGIFENATEPAIAANLQMSQHTVHEHLKRLFQKLDVTTRIELVILIIDELLRLTRASDGSLPPICRHRACGTCPLKA